MYKARITVVLPLFALFLIACQPGADGTSSVGDELPSAEVNQVENESPKSTPTPEPIETLVVPTATPIPGHKERSIADGMNQIYIPAGSVNLGCEDGTPYCYGLERYQIDLAPYWIDETEVTNNMYAVFLNAFEISPDIAIGFIDTASDDVFIQHDGEEWIALEGYENHPAVKVLWLGAEAYCSWAGRRLPFAAEWEHAARGNEEFIFPWGNNDPDSYKVNFCDTNCDMGVTAPDYSRNDRYAKTAPVGTYPEGASPYGALDLGGNAMEWVWDWEISPVLALTNKRVTKGGSYSSTLSNIASFERGPIDAMDPWRSTGFRCAVDAADFGSGTGIPQESSGADSFESSLIQSEDIEYILQANGIPVPEWYTDRKSFSSDIESFLLSTDFYDASGARWSGSSDHGDVSLRVFMYGIKNEAPDNMHTLFPIDRCELEQKSEGGWHICGRTYESGRGTHQHVRGLLIDESLWIEIDYEVLKPTSPMDKAWMDAVLDMLMTQFMLAD